MLMLKSTSTQRLNSAVDDIQSGLSKISTDQAATRSVLEETRNFSRDLTGQVKSTLVPAIQNLSAQCYSISSTQATQATILSATRDSAFSIENDAAQIKAAVSQLVNGGSKDMRLLAAVLQPALEKVITERINAALLTHSDNLVLEAKPNHVQENKPPGESTYKTNTSELHSLRHKTATYSTFRGSSVAKFWFGTLFISSTDETTCEMNFASVKVQKTEYFETQVTLVPSTWLLRTGAVLSVKRLISGIAKPQIQVALRPITMLAWENPVFEAIESLNLGKVKELVKSGSVRPTDICANGKSLFHRALDIMHYRILPFERRAPIPLNLKATFFLTKKKEVLLNMLDICHWLIVNGCSSNAPTPSGEYATPDILCIHGIANSLCSCCFEIMHDVCDIPRETAFREQYGPQLSSLAVAMASRAVTSPFFRLHCGTLIETDLFKEILGSGSWRHFDRAVAASTAADVGALGCLRMLKYLWNSYPYNGGSYNDKLLSTFSWERNQSPEGEESSVRLVRAAKDEKVWLCGDGSELSEALKLLYESIRGALVYASPFHHRRGEMYSPYYYPGPPRKALQAYIGATIASMLSFDTRVASLVHDGETLTQCASKWRVLDVWARALDKAGENPDYHLRYIPRSSLLPLYNLLTFISGPNEASLYLSGDSLKRTCLIVHGHRPEIPQYRNWGDEYPDDEEIYDLTEDWPSKLFNINCEITTSSNIEIVDTSPESEVVDVKHPWWSQAKSESYEVRSTDGGGLELFIDCDGNDLWERLYDKVIGDRKRREEKETEVESEEQAAKPNAPTLRSKVASTGLAILSSIH
jgi:hypothetical protein